MPVEPTPSYWLQQLRRGDRAAVERLWNAYYARLVKTAEQRLAGRVRLIGDEEDIALSAFNSFCRGVELGRFPDLNNRNDLWNLLVTITLNKVRHMLRDEGRAKRGGGRPPAAGAPGQGGADFLQQLADSEPTPAVATEMADEVKRLLDSLASDDLIELALLKMEGYTNEEIAARWGKAERTIERKLHLIRGIWVKQAGL
jgi:DNA-directed RNA polymerase specialized sigma24 family protein